jgi:hypothetical protein
MRKKKLQNSSLLGIFVKKRNIINGTNGLPIEFLTSYCEKLKELCCGYSYTYQYSIASILL